MTTTDDRPTTPAAAPATEDVRAATTREAVLKALLDEVKGAYEEARTDVQDLLDKQQKATGGTKFDAALPDGTKVGSISLTGGEPAAQITDSEAFTAWARAQYPSEAVTRIVKEVRQTFVTRLLGEMTAAGVPQVVDPDTGEVHEVPGVEIKATRKRSHSMNYTRPTKTRPTGGREVVAAAWRSGALAPVVLPALAPSAPAPPASPPPAPRPQVGRRFRAAYDGECSECFRSFDEGDEVAYVDDELCCEQCVEAAA